MTRPTPSQRRCFAINARAIASCGQPTGRYLASLYTNGGAMYADNDAKKPVSSSEIDEGWKAWRA